MANFLVSFITKDMRRSFPAIAEQFLQQEKFLKDPSLIPDSEAKRKYYANGVFRNYLTPRDLILNIQDNYNLKILNLMIDCMRLGSEYSRNLLLALYKIYYKREYNQLKRYSVINEYDLMTLLDDAIREERGSDAALHATNTSRTVGEVMREKLARTPGHMACFESANPKNFDEYLKIAQKGGKVRIEGEAIDVNALFGSYSDDKDEDYIGPHGKVREPYEVTDPFWKQYADRLDEPSIYPTVSRIFIMCEVMGIDIDMTCLPHMQEMNQQRKEISDTAYEKLEGFEESLEEGAEKAIRWVKAVYPQAMNPEEYQKDLFFFPLQLAEDIIRSTFGKYNVPEDALYESRYFDLSEQMGKSIFFLDMLYPGYMTGHAYMLLLAAINYLSECYTELYKTRENELTSLLGIEEVHYIDHTNEAKKIDDKAEKILRSIKTNPDLNKNENHKRDIANSQKEEIPEQGLSESEEIARLKNIIEEQRKELKEKEETIFFKEQDLIQQRTLYESAHKKELEYESRRADFESGRRELIALRDHVFSLSDDDIELDPDHIGEMKEAIAEKRVMIIGGRTNWQRKLRQLFPKWKFVAASDNLSANTVEGMDFIYFFTDFISHSLYYKFVAILRERDMNYYYIHETNIDKNIKQIYGDIVRVT